VEAWLLERARDRLEPTPVIEYMARRLFAPAGIRITDVVEEVGYSQRHVLGLFRRWVGLSFVFCLLMSANLAGFLGGPDTTVGFAIAAGIAGGLGWAALGLGVIALFERRPLSYVLVNGGYLTVSFAVMGAILGVWR